ncbi:MAG: methyltransferase, partial [Desulfobacterota bacterium]|nr:methyltransferase [Thermodesulfobacteriota bacterium]
MRHFKTMSFELHELFSGTLKLYQPKHGYRFSIDSILLADFAGPKVHGMVADLGAGSGIVSLLLVRNPKVTRIVAFEIQHELAALAKKNIVLNHCNDKVTVEHGDIRHIRKKCPAGSCDAVVTNPPFFAVGTGRINPHTQKASARHEMHGALHDFLTAAAYLLKTGGSLFIVYNADRAVDLLTGMRGAKI